MMHRMHSFVVVALAALSTLSALSSCTTNGGPRPGGNLVPGPITFTMPERARCDGSIANPLVIGALDDEGLIEASGVVASLSRSNVLWMNNDEEAKVFAVSALDGRSLGHVRLEGIEDSDFEDIAAGPCPDLTGPCLYLSDTGNNRLDREELYVVAFPEPDVGVDKPLAEGASVPASQIWRFPIATNGERANIEALVIAPDATAMLLFEKKHEDARVFRYSAPWTPNERAILEETTRFDPPGDDGPSRLITGASIHTSGTRLLLRTYVGVFEARFVDDSGVPSLPGGRGFERVSSDDFTFLFTPPDEQQGEAITYDERGDGLFTVSESQEPGQPLHHASCAQER